jgi:hypothetical protein
MEDNIKMDLKEIDREDVKKLNCLRIKSNGTVMNFRVP